MKITENKSLNAKIALTIYSKFVMSYINGEEYMSPNDILNNYNERNEKKITLSILNEYLEFMYEETLLGKVEKEYRFVGYRLIELR